MLATDISSDSVSPALLNKTLIAGMGNFGKRLSFITINTNEDPSAIAIFLEELDNRCCIFCLSYVEYIQEVIWRIQQHMSLCDIDVLSE
ncbi:unnamed protein product [Brugia pahangi]|uniref:Uncharacterized protein n=1 Tax=Brugia pahangi TaxID=6280 RepID=A0A0N4TJG5_BRUPA|nr:unnamed protein product [Brugia pahangi]